MRWEERHISWWDENRKCEVLRFFVVTPAIRLALAHLGVSA